MHLFRRAAVRTVTLHHTRPLASSRARCTRAVLLQTAKPTYLRPFHQGRVGRADEDRTIPVESLEEAAAAEPFEREEVAEQFKQEAVEAAEVAEAAAEAAEGAAVTEGERLEEADAAEAAAVIAGGAAGIAEAASESTPGFAELPSGQVAATEEVAAAAAATAQAAAAAATTSASAASGAREFRPRSQNNRFPSPSQSSPFESPQQVTPSRILYIGNLFFEVTAPQLETEFSKFGQITNSRVVVDNRGMSKGFGYVEFATQESADRAIREANQKVLEGRRMSVQYHMRREPRAPAPARFTSARPANPPSKTLFIGNMSYQMSDRDLNELFREVRDVLDVRVAIDRRSGQPRGFAHADFIDVAAAERAKALLEQKVVYGRQLRIDFSAGSRTSRQAEE